MQVTLEQNASTPFVVPAPKEMLSVRVENGVTYVKVNFSSLSLMQECWQKANYALVRGLKANLESAATLFGSAVHSGLEVFYSGRREERTVPKDYEDTIQMIGCGTWEPDWQEHLLFRAARAFVLKAAPLASLPPGDKRSVQTGVCILQHYFKHYLNDPFVVLTDAEGAPLVERKFVMPVFRDETLVIEAFGQIDVVLRNEATGVILPTDHKTTSVLGSQFYNRLKPNHQYTFYAWACNDVLGLEADSFLVNALQVKEMPKTARGSPPQFARQTTTRTRADFEDLRKTIIRYVRAFLENQKDGEWPMTAPAPCSSYNGCQFLDVCAAPEQLRETIIQAKFTQIGGLNG